MAVGNQKHFSGVGIASPTRSSPRKSSNPHTINKLYPTPLSMSPSTASTISISTSAGVGINGGNTIGTLRFPPSFDPNHPSSRYHNQNYTPFSPYRPGEYGRSERGLASDRTKIERKLFDDDDDDDVAVEDNEIKRDENKLVVDTPKKEGSSPLAPAFQAKMVLRNGASIDLISWLRTNFHHLPPPHTVLTPCMPLNGIRHLLLERFPRAPEVEEISKAVLAAFPHSQWDYPTGTSSEPPNIRGLVWHGKDITDEDDVEDSAKPPIRSSSGPVTRKISSTINTELNGTKQTSRSPTQSTLVSPISSSKRHLPDTPARSVLEEFAEIATLADKTPTLKAKSLPDDDGMNSEYQLDEAVDQLNKDFMNRNHRKRHASQSPDFELGHRRRASTSDKLHGLLAAAEAVEGSPITSVLNLNQKTSHGHKRRRTIGGIGSARELMGGPSSSYRKNRLSRGTLSPPISGRFNGFLPSTIQENDYVVPLNDTTHNEQEDYREEDAISNSIPLKGRAPTSSSTSQSSIVSSIIPSSTLAGPSTTTNGSGRKVNELPTEGDAPGYDCKPPYPYHEMIRHAIENAPDCRLQLSQIYSSIADRFPFFKTLDEKKTAGWQNSIRHNLSLKKMFVRVNKPDGIPDDSGGKGGWWTVQPGVPDEGRPGRKAKAKKAKADQEGDGGEEHNDDGEGNTSMDVDYQNIIPEQNSILTTHHNGYTEEQNDITKGMIERRYNQQQDQVRMILPQIQYDITNSQGFLDEKSNGQNNDTQISIHEAI